MSSMVFMLRLSIGSIEQECQTFRVRLEIQRLSRRVTTRVPGQCIGLSVFYFLTVSENCD
jgi:hypothetical protein